MAITSMTWQGDSIWLPVGNGIKCWMQLSACQSTLVLSWLICNNGSAVLSVTYTANNLWSALGTSFHSGRRQNLLLCLFLLAFF